MRGPSCIRATQLPFASPQWLFGFAPAAVSLVYIPRNTAGTGAATSGIGSSPSTGKKGLSGNCSKKTQASSECSDTQGHLKPTAMHVIARACHVYEVCAASLLLVHSSPATLGRGKATGMVVEAIVVMPPSSFPSLTSNFSYPRQPWVRQRLSIPKNEPENPGGFQERKALLSSACFCCCFSVQHPCFVLVGAVRAPKEWAAVVYLSALRIV